MSDNKTFGSQFLEALDEASGAKNFNYAKRKEIRQKDRDAILAQYGLSDVANVAELTAKEAVKLLKAGSASGLSPEEEVMLNSTLMLLNIAAVSSD